jgi:hypothetical protein
MGWLGHIRLTYPLSANPLGITLKYLDDGALTIGLNGEPDSVGVVAKPSK